MGNLNINTTSTISLKNVTIPVNPNATKIKREGFDDKTNGTGWVDGYGNFWRGNETAQYQYKKILEDNTYEYIYENDYNNLTAEEQSTYTLAKPYISKETNDLGEYIYLSADIYDGLNNEDKAKFSEIETDIKLIKPEIPFGTLVDENHVVASNNITTSEDYTLRKTIPIIDALDIEWAPYTLIVNKEKHALRTTDDLINAISTIKATAEDVTGRVYQEEITLNDAKLYLLAQYSTNPELNDDKTLKQRTDADGNNILDEVGYKSTYIFTGYTGSTTASEQPYFYTDTVLTDHYALGNSAGSAFWGGDLGTT